MPFCPECRSEYQPNITHCPDCDLDLVAELTPENMIFDTSEATMVELRTFANAAEAEMVQELLQQNSIRSLIQSGIAGSSLFPTPITATTILVDERDLASAQDLVEAFLETEVVAEEAEAIPEPAVLAISPKSNDNKQFIVVLITVDKAELAETLAEALVTAQLAACVNIVPQIRSIYRWEGKICRDEELLLIVKTERQCYERLEAHVRQLHSASTPEIISLPIITGSADYLQWLHQSLN